MNVDKESWMAKFFRVFFTLAVFLMFCLNLGLPAFLSGQGLKRILLPGIEMDLAKKQIPVDFGETSRALTPLLNKAFSMH